MQPAAIVGRPAGQQARGRFGQPSQRPAPGQLAAQDRPRVLAVGGAAAAGAPEQDRVPQQPGDGAEVVPGLALLLGEQEVGGPDQRADRAAAHEGEHGYEGHVDREHVQGATPVEQPRMTARGRGLPDLPGRQIAVVHHRVGDHPDVVAGGVHPPAEVDVVAHQGQVGVESADLVPDVAADQHARRTHRQHRPVAVVLALVDLAGLDPGETPSRPVDGDARLAQHPPVGQVHQLGAEHRRGAVAAGRPEHLLQGVRGWLAVVVQQPDPLHRRVRRRAGFRHRPARRGVLQRAGDGGAVPGVGVHAEDRVRTEELGQRGSAPVLAAGVDADRAVHRMRLLPYRVDEPREQSRTVVHNDHEGHHVAQRQGVF